MELCAPLDARLVVLPWSNCAEEEDATAGSAARGVLLDF